jgi:hypothetical protein
MCVPATAVPKNQARLPADTTGMAFPSGRLSSEAQAARVRDGLRKRGYRATDLNDKHAGRVLAKVDGDVELAVEAIALWPRPTWVEALIGPSSHDRALGEMLSLEDKAPAADWGALGFQ